MVQHGEEERIDESFCGVEYQWQRIHRRSAGPILEPDRTADEHYQLDDHDHNELDDNDPDNKQLNDEFDDHDLDVVDVIDLHDEHIVHDLAVHGRA